MSEHPHITPSTQWHARATAVLPGGGFGNFPPEMILERGKGGRVWDVDGNEYVDFLLGSGPMFIGHCHPEVSAAVDAQLALGTTFFANNSSGIALAEDIVAALPAAEQVRFVSSGTEADMYAMRLARAYRKRELILKFEGGYHGMSDHALMSLAPKRLVNLPRPVPDSAGICGHVEDEVLVAPFNDIDAAVKLIASHADQLAGVIVEPLQRLIPPKPGFLEALRAETEARDIPLIFDEVVTGFRFGYGGAQSLYGVTPDLCTLGKIIGGGFALGAVTGRADIMAHFDAGQVGGDDFLLQIGTLSGNPVAAVAGRATLKVLRETDAYARAEATGNAIMAALTDHFARVGIPAQVVGHPTLFDVVFTAEPVEDFRAVFRADGDRLKHFNALMAAHGVLKPASKFYISAAHDAADLAQTIDAIAAAADEMAA